MTDNAEAPQAHGPLRVALTSHVGIGAGGDGSLVDAGGVGRLGRLTFAYLVTDRHRPVPREELADVLWGDDLPRTWETSLRVVVSRLRTWLAAAGLDRSESLTSAFGCYQLHLPDGASVDVEEAAAALAGARAALAAGDAAAAFADATAAAEAAALEFLPGAAGAWVERRQAEWRELRVGALETRAMAALAMHDAESALTSAEEAARLEPLRESAHVLVIRALADAGNRAEALRAYEHLRHALAEELGVPPSPQTEAAYLSLLRDDPEPPTVASAAATAPALPALPTALSSFVGREAEVAEVVSRLGSARLVTLTGTGGLGKTRLALEVAARTAVAGDVALMSLAELIDGRGVVPRALDALGLAEEPGRTPAETLAAGVVGRQLLVVVDNCEHVVDDASALVAALLSASPDLVVLATSREPLRVPGEVVLRVPPLTADDAARLFVERSAAASGGPAGSDEAVADLCRHLDGIPLAIELAAARTSALSVRQIAERLDDRFRLLTGGARTAPERHQTMAGAVDWSYDALSPDERELFHGVSVFAGAFTLEAAEAVAAGDGDVVNGLTALVARSLVQAVPSDPDMRYRLLETLRAYAAGKQRASGGASEAHARLVAWAAGVAEEAESHLAGPDQAAWLDRLDADYDNLVAALAAAPAGLRGPNAVAGLRGPNAVAVDTLRLAAALGRFWEVRGRFQEGRDWLRTVLADARESPPLLRARAENAAALLAQHQGDYAAAASRLEQSLALRRQAGDRLGVGIALHGLGNLAALQHDKVAARRLYEESLATGQELGDTSLVAAALDNLAWVAHAEGDFARAGTAYEEALDARREAGDAHGTALVLGHLGDLAYQQGDYDRASSLHKESLEIRTALGDRAGRADSLATLGHLALHDAAGLRGPNAVAGLRGPNAVAGLDEARALLGESLALRRDLGDRAGLPNALANLSDLALLTGDLEEARVHLKEAAAVAAASRDNAALAHVLVHHGRLALAEGRPDLAAQRYREARDKAGDLAADPVTAEWLEGVGATLVAGNDSVAGARLLGAASALRDAIGAPTPPYERPARDREIASARKALGKPGFTAAWKAGLALTLGDALAEAGAALAD